jgi:hypothetical protein
LADKTRQALAFEQLRSHRTHLIGYAGGPFDIFETLSLVRFVLQLPVACARAIKVADSLVRFRVDWPPLFCKIFLFAKGVACPARKSDRRFIGRNGVNGLEMSKKVTSLMSHEVAGHKTPEETVAYMFACFTIVGWDRRRESKQRSFHSLARLCS